MLCGVGSSQPARSSKSIQGGMFVLLTWILSTLFVSISLSVSVWMMSRPALVVSSCATIFCSTSLATLVPIGVTLTPPDGDSKDGNPEQPDTNKAKVIAARRFIHAASPARQSRGMPLRLLRYDRTRHLRRCRSPRTSRQSSCVALHLAPL